jgi:hypothetical protein
MSGYNPCDNPTVGLNPGNYFSNTWWDRFFATLDWLKNEADDETYWDYWTKCDGLLIPKRKKDSWLDRLKHRNTFLGRLARRFERKQCH